jgi:hypothetical protein
MSALKVLPEPTKKHGPATRHVTLSGRHDGQIVTPVVNAWHVGKKYLVQLSAYDASDRTFAEPEEFVGDFWACTKWLSDRGVQADIDAA